MDCDLVLTHLGVARFCRGGTDVGAGTFDLTLSTIVLRPGLKFLWSEAAIAGPSGKSAFETLDAA
jgi:hypothetical protein